MKDRSHYPLRITDENNQVSEDLAYWLSRTPGERIAAMEILREQFYALRGYAETPRIQKIITMRNNP